MYYSQDDRKIVKNEWKKYETQMLKLTIYEMKIIKLIVLLIYFEVFILYVSIDAVQI